MPKQETKETLVALFEGTGLPEDKQEEFKSIFEAAVKVEAKELAEAYSEYIKEEQEKEIKELSEKAEAYAEYVVEETTTKVDEYLNYVTESLFEENKLAITNGCKANLFDSLMTEMKELFAKHNVVIADDQVNVVAELEEKNAELVEALNKSKKKEIDFIKEKQAAEKSSIISEACKGLSDVQSEKVAELAEEIEYSDNFASTVKTLVETVKVKPAVINNNDSVQTEIIEETKKDDNKAVQENANPYMNLYLKTLAE